jgi:hypothetical protein
MKTFNRVPAPWFFSLSMQRGIASMSLWRPAEMGFAASGETMVSLFAA